MRFSSRVVLRPGAPSRSKIALLVRFSGSAKRAPVQRGGYIELYREKYEGIDGQTMGSLFAAIDQKVHVACDPNNLAEALVYDLDGQCLGTIRAHALVEHWAELPRRDQGEPAEPAADAERYEAVHCLPRAGRSDRA